jgi:hypothetical protein
VPCIYAYYYKLYFYSILLLITAIISVNFWRKPTYSWRRNLDLIYTAILFIIFLTTGLMYVNYIPYIILASIGLIIAFYVYKFADKLINKHWYTYHILFHFIAMLGFLLVLYSINKL